MTTEHNKECSLCEEVKPLLDLVCPKCYNELLGTKEKDGMKKVIKIIDYQLDNSVLLSIETRILNKLKERILKEIK